MSAPSLRSLGLNALESEVYTLLLAEPEPVTAYRIAKKLGKPTANVYKAIDALVVKGTVVLDESEPRLCRPVAAEEFLGHLEQSFAKSIRVARSELSRLGEPAPDERVYQLQATPLVLERARRMLARAERIVVVEAFPRAVAELEDAIRETAARGISVYLQHYGPLALGDDLEHLHAIDTHEGEASRIHWRSEQLNLVVDGRELLVALLGDELERVHQALWSNSLYLACLLHAGMLREHFYCQVGELARGEPQDSPLNELLSRHPVFHSIEVPGQHELFERLGMLR